MDDMITISVRSLVEFLMASGDIDGGFSSIKRAQEGTRLHQKHQKKMMEELEYQKEVFLETETEKEGIRVHLEGRADGIYMDPLEIVVVVDEIKTVSQSLASMEEDQYPVHWAQAEGYAYLYAMKYHQERMKIRLTYIQTRTEQVRYFYRDYSFEKLQEIFRERMDRFYEWLILDMKRKEQRNRQLQEMRFPFPTYRDGQRTMAAYIYRSIRDRDKLFLQAPTGIGKTISALFPALKAQGEGYADKIFYLTARGTTREAAAAMVRRIREHGTDIRYVELTAKDAICPLENGTTHRSCHPEDCPYAKGHFDRIRKAVMELLKTEQEYTTEKILKWADRYQVCPFELSLDLSTWSDLIIGDYNYAFDPTASLKRFFSEQKTDHVLLIDEAHNLVDRGREMFSAVLQKEKFLEAGRLLKAQGQDPKDPVMKQLRAVNKAFLDLKKGLPEEKEASEVLEIPEPPEALIYAVSKWVGAMDELLAESGGTLPDEVLTLYFDSNFYRKLAEEQSEGYFHYIRCQGKDVIVRMHCYHPAKQLQKTFDLVRSSVMFSATLSPAPYYTELLGAAVSDPVIDLPSPFDPKKRLVMVADQVETTYQHRQRTIPEVTALIHEAIRVREGNYFVFFPSFAYMNQVVDAYQDVYPEDTIYVQVPEMSLEQRQEILNTMEADGKARLLFAVLGGVFSESIDLQGERILGAIVVTVGLPQISYERDRIRDTMGFEYAYSYPGIGKVLQAAGRVIRTEEDRGILLLIDSRYRSPNYRKLLPGDWYPIQRVTADTINQCVSAFWNNQKQE